MDGKLSLLAYYTRLQFFSPFIVIAAVVILGALVTWLAVGTRAPRDRNSDDIQDDP